MVEDREREREREREGRGEGERGGEVRVSQRKTERL